jgi:1-phosphofructokinase family hexose kinase
VTDLVVIATSPAIDRIARSCVSVREGIVRTDAFLETPGGKGTHVAMVAQRLGADVALVAPAGGVPGRLFAELLDLEGLAPDLVPVNAATRGTYTLVDPERGDLFEIHEPPVRLESCEVEELVVRAIRVLNGASVVVIAGGLPRGAAADLHADLARAAHEAGATCIVDTSSAPALRKALHAGAPIVIPNLAEANAATGRVVGSDAPVPTIIQLGRELLELGGSTVVLTLGARGALIVHRDGEAWHVSAPPIGKRVNAVGCGDALVGGLAAALVDQQPLPDAIALGAAAAADKLTRLHSGQIDALVVREIAPRVELRRVA